MNLAALRTLLANALATVTGLTSFAVVPLAWAGPAALVRPGPISVHFDLGVGDPEVAFTVQLLVPLGSNWATAQNTLDALCSIGTSPTTSVIDALEAHAAIQVDTIDPQGVVAYRETEYLSATLHGQILT